jgi:hypothetical protein
MAELQMGKMINSNDVLEFQFERLSDPETIPKQYIAKWERIGNETHYWFPLDGIQKPKIVGQSGSFVVFW